jgi:hypothetical protein
VQSLAKVSENARAAFDGSNVTEGHGMVGGSGIALDWSGSIAASVEIARSALVNSSMFCRKLML